MGRTEVLTFILADIAIRRGAINQQNINNMKPAKLKSYFGAWLVVQGEVVFPKLFNSKKEAQDIVKQINSRQE